MLIALAWPTHIHHRTAHQWFEKESRHGWATCPMTECGFVRVSSNPRIIPDAVTPQAAIGVLRDIVRIKGHRFWPDDLPLDEKLPSRTQLVGHNQVTDAYLLALAVKHDGYLVTLDSGIRSLLSKNSPLIAHLIVISS